MTYRKFYLLSLIAILLISIYPIYMGIVTLVNYLQYGSIAAADYKKYVIPYTPICLSLIVSAAILPLLFLLIKRFTLLFVSLLGTTLFVIFEYAFEQIKVVEDYTILPLESWQYSLCIATPEVLRSIGEPIYAENNPAYKVHFYIIAIVIILATLNVIYGFSVMLLQQSYQKLRPLVAQTVSLVLFIGLCILACFTAFFRNGQIHISPISAVLMTLFFIIFGVTVGLYTGSILYGRKALLSKIIPSIIASVTTFVMYIGELILMGGVLFRYGTGLFFSPIGSIPFSFIDIVIIISSGIVTYFLMVLLNRKHKIST
jgi:hypothetical protein